MGGKQATKGRASGKQTWICAACELELTSWAACERHSDSEGHHRFRVIG